MRFIIHFCNFQEQTIIKTFIKKRKAELQAKSGRAHSNKYDGFFMRCLLLKLKSCTTFNNMKKNNILPLLSVSTIRRRLSLVDCKFGFNELTLESIKKELANLPPVDQWGSIMWDE